MTMRTPLPKAALLSCLTVLGACQPSPPSPVAASAASAADTEAAAGVEPAEPPATHGAPSPDAATVDAARSAVRPGAMSPGNVVRSYVNAVLRRDGTAIDSFWQLPTRGARPPDDAVLHALRDVRTLRVTAQTPAARDNLSPTRLLEVPVRIRAVTATGEYTYRGWYRLVPDRDGSAWLIQSAQLQPVMD